MAAARRDSCWSLERAVSVLYAAPESRRENDTENGTASTTKMADDHPTQERIMNAVSAPATLPKILYRIFSLRLYACQTFETEPRSE